jgi:hypothetical protein
MSLLAAQQEALLCLLFDRSNGDASIDIAEYICPKSARGQKVYQSNGHALACSALRAAYPVVAQLLGDESVDALAQALWHHQPPQRGDASQWGQALPAFVRDNEQLSDEPYLADVVTVEWALHCAATAADAHTDAPSFALLGEHDPLDLQLLLAPGSACVESAWPVVSIIHAHLHRSPTLAHAGQLLRAGVGEDAIIWRQALQVRVRVAMSGEAAFVTALLKGQTLGRALELTPDIDIAAWLPMAVQTGMLLGVRLAEASPSAVAD